MRTRFAPSPTGPMHLGHAYSAILAHDMAREAGGEFLLRIEDTDISRARPEWEALIREDLRWLGLDWTGPVRRQSDHLTRYEAGLDSMAGRGLLFPCGCTRADIRAALSAPQEGAETLEGIYPGTCRGRSMTSRAAGDAVRLDMARAIAALGRVEHLSFQETGPIHGGTHHLDPKQLLAVTGDVVLGRKDIGTVAYALAAVMDDAEDAITHVVRGADLFEITSLQVLLQALMGLPTPIYHHHRLIRDDTGKRLAKRDDARAIRKFRDDGATPQDIRKLVGL